MNLSLVIFILNLALTLASRRGHPHHHGEHRRLSVDPTSVPNVELRNAAVPGLKMPAIGLGTGAYMFSPRTAPGEIWNDTVAKKAVLDWLDAGGRRIDASLSYRNQPGVGEAIAATKVPREQLFITSKVGNGGLISGAAMGYNDTLVQIDPVLKTLQTTYVDLLLIHWPGPPGNSSDPACKPGLKDYRACRQSTWRAMQKLFKDGKTRAIGVSNFEQNHLEDIISMGEMLPSLNQVEFHPYWHEDDLLALCKKYNIAFNGYSPLGCPDWAPASHNWTHTLLEEPVVIKIAAAHGVPASQVVLAWEWQQDVSLNPRTENPQHMVENLSFFKVKLSAEEMQEIANIKPPAKPKVCPDPSKIL